MPDIVRPGAVTGNPFVMAQTQLSNNGYLVNMGWLWRGRITFRDLTAAAGSQVLDIAALFSANRGASPNIIGGNFVPQNIFAGQFFVDLVERFSGGAVSAATVILGRAASTSSYLTSTNVFTSATPGYASTPGATESAMRAFIGAAAFAPIATIATTGGNVNTLTQGILDVYFHMNPLPSRRPAVAP